MKRMKLNIMEAAKFAFGTSLIGYFLSLIFFALSCENAKVAGVTVSYNRWATPGCSVLSGFLVNSRLSWINVLESRSLFLQIRMQEMTAIHSSLCALSLPPSVDAIPYDKHSVFTGCNSDCFCSVSDWDPICGENGITYVSPCLAACTSSAGSGKNTVSYQDLVFYSNPQPCDHGVKNCWPFSLLCSALLMVVVRLYPSIWWCRCGVLVCVCHCLCMSPQVFSNCSCIGVAGNFTARTGQCHHTDDCDRMFPYFLALSVITSFIISLGGTPGYMILIRSDSKSFSRPKTAHVPLTWNWLDWLRPLSLHLLISWLAAVWLASF